MCLLKGFAHLYWCFSYAYPRAPMWYLGITSIYSSIDKSHVTANICCFTGTILLWSDLPNKVVLLTCEQNCQLRQVHRRFSVQRIKTFFLSVLRQVFGRVRNLLTMKLPSYAVWKVTIKLIYMKVLLLGWILAGPNLSVELPCLQDFSKLPYVGVTLKW